MEKISVNIVDVTLDAPVATSIELDIMEVVLNSHVTVVVRFLNSTGNLIKNEIIRIEGAEYAAWGSDDNYIINLVISKLNLSQA
jgi:hypothetical protein